MKSRDIAALSALQQLVADLRGTGAIELLEDEVAATWAADVARYSPTELGDTPRALGFTASENLRERVVRRCTGTGSPWPGRGVRAFTSNTSMVMQAAGVEVRVKKAPYAPHRVPSWWAFDWAGDSACRRQAAARNATAYYPPMPPPGQELITGLTLSYGDPADLRDVFMVWAGDIETGLTAGWLGYPTTGPSPWLAVEPLWWHVQPRPRSSLTPSAPRSPAGSAFDQQHDIQPSVGLKRLEEEMDRA